MFPRGESYYRRNNWAGRVTTEWGERVFDSPLNNATAHYLHNMLYVLGPTRETSATPAWLEAELYRANDIENYDTAALRCRTTCGAEVLFYTTHAAPERHRPGVPLRVRARGRRVRPRPAADSSSRGSTTGTVRDYGQPELDRNEKIWQSIDAVRTRPPPSPAAPQAALPHTLCVAAAQASSPASHRHFPAALRRRGAVAGEGTMVWVDGLGRGADRLLRARPCCRRKRVPRGHGPAGASHVAPAGAEQSTATPSSPLRRVTCRAAPRPTPRRVSVRASHGLPRRQISVTDAAVMMRDPVFRTLGRRE